MRHTGKRRRIRPPLPPPAHPTTSGDMILQPNNPLLFPAAHASFAQPVDMLLACHDKVRRFCAQLDALPAHLAAHGCDAAAQQGIAQIRRYFNQAAPLHHADEEVDFFPLLLRHCPEAAADVVRLQAEHEQLHQTWARLDAHLAALAAGHINMADAALIASYLAQYRQHMAIEEPWFALAVQRLPAAALTAAGQAMAARRMPAASGSPD